MVRPVILNNGNSQFTELYYPAPTPAPAKTARSTAAVGAKQSTRTVSVGATPDKQVYPSDIPMLYKGHTN